MNVRILATCRKPDLLPFTLLVFDTLRVGFPNAKVVVTINEGCASDEIRAACFKVDAAYCHVKTIHHEWIANLLEHEAEPFWLVDTDMIFYGNVEGWQFNEALAGCRIPEWRDEYSGAVTRARLHTSLLHINPAAVQAALAKFRSVSPQSPFTPFVNVIYPLCLPFRGQMYFYDTTALLYHAIGGTAFTDEQKDAYFHFNFGTIEDMVLPRLSGSENMAGARRRVLNKPELGKGMWRAQELYYASRPV